MTDAYDRPFRGYKKKDCTVMKGNSTRQLISWKDKNDLSGLAGKKVKIKFYLTDGELSSSWVSPWKKGRAADLPRVEVPDLMLQVSINGEMTGPTGDKVAG